MPDPERRGTSLSTGAPATGAPAPASVTTASTSQTVSSSSSAPASRAPASSTPADASAPKPTPAAPVQSSRSSFLSRLNLPLPLSLRNRNRNVADFHIRCDEPYKKYTAGEHVRGSVVLVIVKAVRLTHLVVSLHGHVRVHSNPNAVSKLPVSLTQGGGTDRPRYHGNGLASLFQDEQVLSGEGRLEPGQYEFGFDLVFPETGLPGSIDFERGSVSYMITSTLTRPTPIVPTTTCDRKVSLVEKVDIGLLAPPRPRTIFLEPISKKTRRKKSMGLDKASNTDKTHILPPETSDLTSETGSIEPSSTTDSNRDASQIRDRNIAPVDTRSEISGESGRSISTAISRADFAQTTHVGTPLASPSLQQAVDEKTITATIELLRGGCLPGDVVTVRVAVQHIKRIKSMSGVIVTLFRQARIDSSPSPALFSDTKTEQRRRAQKDEAYPRSRTKLGGLSLSSTSSTSVFRKDLDQNQAPLFIDPMTLQASVTVSVKVPDDSFPSMKGVPGDMIGFKYQIEVIVDLGGKLSSQFQGNRFGNESSDPNSHHYTPRRGRDIADTAHLRREKGVVSVSMETVIGTVDTSRGRRRRVSPSSRPFRVTESDDDDVIRPELGYLDDASYTPQTDSHLSINSSYFPQQSLEPRYMAPSRPQPPVHQLRSPQSSQARQYEEQAPSYVPPPQMGDDRNLSEKERIRQAETRLLPSQPSAGPSSADDDGQTPTAPPATIDEDGDENLEEAGDDTPRAPQREDHNPMDAAIGRQQRLQQEQQQLEPSAPTEDELRCSESPQRPREDKEEMERRRLMGEASAPPEFPEDMQRGSSSAAGPSRPDAGSPSEPSAPVMHEEDDEDDYRGYGVGPGSSRDPRSGHGEQLPAYER